MRNISFFAKKNDLLPVLDLMQSGKAVQYVRARKMSSPEADMWKDCDGLPDLGIASGDQSAACNSFLMMEREAIVHVQSQIQLDGITRFDVDQGANPDSIVLTPGGVWKDGALIAGRFATASGSAVAQGLMRLADAGIRRSFVKVNAFWVGPEALQALRAGVRLCYAVQSPAEFDLREKTRG